MLSRHRAAPPQPWTDNPGFRMNASPRVQVRMKIDESVRTVVLDQKDLTIPVGVWIETAGDMLLIGRPGELFACTLSQPRGSGGGAALDGAIISPMPGRLISVRSEEHTSELQSLMRISYAVFCLKKKIHIYKP